MKAWRLLVFLFAAVVVEIASGQTSPQATLKLISTPPDTGISGISDGNIGIKFKFWAQYSGGTAPASADYSIPVPGREPVTGTMNFSPGGDNVFANIFIPMPYSQIAAQNTIWVTATISNPVNLKVEGPYSTGGPTQYPDFKRQFIVTGNTVTEGNTGTTFLTFTASLNSPINEDATFRYITGTGTATPGTDYTPVTGTGTIPAGSVSTTINVPVKGDQLEEADETVLLDVSEFSVPLAYSPFSVFNTPGKIVNDDSAVNAVPAATAVTEARGTDTAKAWFAVNLTSAKAVPVTVRVSTRDGTAVAGSDYRPLAPTNITIPAGEMRAWVAITVTATPQDENQEQFFLDVEDPGSGEVRSAVCSIVRLAVKDISRTAPNTLTLTFTTGNTQRYYIEEASAPDGEWTLATNALAGTGGPLSWQVPLSQGRRFYRVRTYAPLAPGTPSAST